MTLAWIADPQAWMALLTLTALEIILGIDNIIILTILVGKLPKKDKPLGRVLGLGLAMGTRIALLLSIVWVMRLTVPLFSVLGKAITGRDIILIVGGLFLLIKSIPEIYQILQGQESSPHPRKHAKHFWSVIIQIALIDIVFSLDSVITAVGLANDIPIMIIAIVIAVFIMMFAAKAIGDFVDKYPTIKILALTFLVLVGFTLMIEGMNIHISKNYIYFAMGFSTLVEILNLKLYARHENKTFS